MSSKSPVRRKSIRVNMRFGPNSDARLVRQLESLAPYARAKLVRQLVIYGLRYVKGELKPSVTVSAPPPQSIAPTPETVTPMTPDNAFANSVSALLGKTVL